MKNPRNYISKRGKGKMRNEPMGLRGFECNSQLTKSGKVYKNNLLDTDSTSQTGFSKKLMGS